MKKKSLGLIAILVICHFIASAAFSADQAVTTNRQISSKPSATTISPDTLEMINDFATTFKIDPYDVNKDGTVDVNDTASAKAGYALAVQYANNLPANVRTALDRNKDGKVTGLDMVLATDNIVKTIIASERSNRPAFKFVNMPAFNFAFIGRDDLMINENRTQKFDSLTDHSAYQPADIGEETLAKLAPDEYGAASEEDAIVFGDIATVVERVKYADFNFNSGNNSAPAPDEKWLVVYNSNLAPGVRAKLDLEKAGVLDEKDALIFNSFITRLAAVIEYVKYATGSDSCSMTDLSVDQDGNIQCLFETGQGHDLKVIISTNTGAILNSKETLKTYDAAGNMISSETAIRVYDDSGTLQIAQYTASFYDSGSLLTSQVIESVKLDTASGAIIESSYTKATNIDASGTIMIEVTENTVFGADDNAIGSSITESRYNASGVLVERVASVSISDNAGRSDTGTKLLVEYFIDAAGAVVSTNVYNEQEEKVIALSGEGYKDPDLFIRSVKAAQEAELKAAELKTAKEAELKAAKEAELKAAQEAELKAVKEAELKAAQEAELKAAKEAELKAAKEAADLKSAKDAELKAAKEAELKATKEAELKAAETETAKRLHAEMLLEQEKIKAAEETAKVKAAQEAELKAAKDAELKAAKEAELKAAQEAADLKAAQETELKAAKEAELKATKEAELKAAETETAKRLHAEMLLEQEKIKAAEETAKVKAAQKAELKAAKETEEKAAAELKAAEKAAEKAAKEAELISAPFNSESDMVKKLNDEVLATQARLEAAREAEMKSAKEVELKASQEAAAKAAVKVAEPVQSAPAPFISTSAMATRLSNEVLLAQETLKAAQAAELKVAEKEIPIQPTAEIKNSNAIGLQEPQKADKEELKVLELIQPVLESALSKVAEALHEQKTDSKEIDILKTLKLASKVTIFGVSDTPKKQETNDKNPETIKPLQPILELVGGKVAAPQAEAKERLARKMPDPLYEEVLPLREGQKVDNKGTDALRPVQPDFELIQRKAIEEQVYKQATDKHFIGEMANPSKKEMMPLQKKNNPKNRNKPAF